MNILLIYTNRNTNIAPPPVGLSYISHELKAHGHQVELLDLMFTKKPITKIDKAIQKTKPQIVGFSIRNLDNQEMLDSDNPLPDIKDYITHVKQKGIVTVIGGTAFTTLPKECYEYMNPDYGFIGQAEKAFAKFVNDFNNTGFEKNIPGLVWRNNGDIFMNNQENYGYCGSQNDTSIWNLKNYRKSFVSAAVITKTGCQYKCAYCSPKTTWGDKFIFRDVQEVVEDMKKQIKLYNARNFFIIDPCFNAPIEYAKNLLYEIIKANLRVYINTAIVPVKGHYDDELFKLHRKAGGVFCMIGAESFSKDMLMSLRKPFGIEDALKCCKLAEKHKCLYGIQSLFGGPGENYDTMQEAINHIPDINFALYLYSIGIRILPNTHIYDLALKEGIISEHTSLLFPKYYVSKDIDIYKAINMIEDKLNPYKYRMMKMLNLSIRNLLAKANIIYK